jgi:hypothetical protein
MKKKIVSLKAKEATKLLGGSRYDLPTVLPDDKLLLLQYNIKRI